MQQEEKKNKKNKVVIYTKPPSDEYPTEGVRTAIPLNAITAISESRKDKTTLVSVGKGGIIAVTESFDEAVQKFQDA